MNDIDIKEQIPVKLVKSEIISCSRRTDVPAFHMDWVLDQIKKGFVEVINPFNRNQISYISLNPEDARLICWWSKDFRDWIKKYNENYELFRKFHHLFNFTINSPSELENGLKSSLENRIKQLKWLVDTFGPVHVQYRFDPIVHYKKISNQKSNGEILDNLDKFEYLISKVSDFGVKETIFSFVTAYSKVRKRMIRRGNEILELNLVEKKKILTRLIDICRSYGVSLHACCQPELVGFKGIKQAHCINGDKISEILSVSNKFLKDKGQRDSCGCVKSRDIGGYTGMFRCAFNCAYCYANPAKK
jgi:hypothetical protein